MTASNVVKANITRPMMLVAIPIHRTVRSCILPVTVGRDFVLSITVSISTSYQLLMTSAPPITSVLPIIVSKNISKLAAKEAPVKQTASQNPAKTGTAFAISTGNLNSDFKSATNDVPFSLLDAKSELFIFDEVTICLLISFILSVNITNNKVFLYIL